MDYTFFVPLYVAVGTLVATIVTWTHQARDVNALLAIGALFLWPLYVIKWVGYALYYMVMFIYLAIETVIIDLLTIDR